MLRVAIRRRSFMNHVALGSAVAFFAVAVLNGAAFAADPKPVEFKVGLVLDRGGKDDKSFNAAAYEGCVKAEKELKVELRDVEAKNTADMEAQLRNMATRKYDIIIAVGFAQADAVKKIGKQFPERKFAIVDSQVDLPNVASLMFAEHEGAFLAGAAAGLKSKSGKVGFVGGMEIPLIQRFEKGYRSGATYVNPKIEVFSNYIGVESEAWTNTGRAAELAIKQFSQGVDVVFGAAGAATMGLFDAADKKKQFAIGVDSNQNGVKPGRVLTSMLKRIDVAVFDIIKAAKDKKFTSGVHKFDLANNGVALAMDEHNKGLLDGKALAKLEAIRKDIIAGKIKVPDAYTK